MQNSGVKTPVPTAVLTVNGKSYTFGAHPTTFISSYVYFRLMPRYLDLQVHDGANPGKSVGKDPEQSAIPEAGVRGGLDHSQKLLNLTFDEGGCFPFGP
jgi:hypothetical protein